MKYLLLLLGILGLVFVLTNRKNVKAAPQGTELDQDNKTCSYEKKCLMTEIEKKFYDAIKNGVSDNHIVLPQVNLATIIKKQGDFKYQNELYRNVDFGVFDKDYNCVLLIEINDETHTDPKRKKRDIKVKEIVQSASIPLVTFYTKYGINQEYIAKRIKESI